MATRETCPSSDCLKALLDDALSEAEQAGLTRHVEACELCQQNLEGLVAGKDSWSDLARHLGRKSTSEEVGHSATEGAKRGEDTGKTLAEPAGGDPSLAFLDPPNKPKQLGRLGHYEIQEVIGKGGFGIVLKAFDEKLHRVVAIKVLAPELAASATARNRFIREARAAAAVTHDHVVTIHVVDEEHRPPYLVMQLIDGMTLQQKLDKVGAFSLKEVLRIGMQMAEGLAAAHKQGLVHRDIKPANVLLENGIERVKITDFGLAKIADDASVTQSGVVAGTPMYMSPEQANGQTIDHRSDLFSLGTVLYVMCTGRPPFRASGTMAVLKRVIDDTPRPVREINPEVPDWLEAIIARLHAKNPTERFQSARELADVLGEKLAELQSNGRARNVSPLMTAAPATTVSRKPRADAPRSPRTSAKLIIGLVAVVLLLAVMVPVGLVALYFFSDSQLVPNPGIDPRPDDNLVVVLDDPAVRVVVIPEQGGQHGVEDFDRQVSCKLAPGRYQVQGTKNGVLVFQEWLTLEAGQKKIVQMDSSWVQLFNGQDLTGWKHAHWTDPLWKVEDGNLTVKGVAWLLTDKGYKDFHCRFEAKINKDGWGELNMRPNQAGMNVAVPMVVGHATGSIFRAGANKGGPIFLASKTDWAAPDTWVTIEVIAKGQNVTVMVNGTKTAEKVIEEIGAEGPISLCQSLPNGVFTVRKIEIKELPPEEPGWVQLFNGKDLSGWKPFPADKDVWRVEDGILIGRGAAHALPHALLPSERKDYRDFHLRVEAMINEGGNSGVWVRSDLKSQDGYEANINHSHRDPARTGSFGVKVAGKQKWLHDQKNSPALANSWFTLEVIAAGPNFTVKIDGVTIAQVTNTNRSVGHIGLEMFEKNSVAHFRKIELKELPTTLTATPLLAVAPFNIDKAKEHQDAWAKHLGVEPGITNSIGMRLRLIPPGEFLMGSSPEEIEWLLNEAPDLKDAPGHIKDNVRSEGPQRRVTIKEPFFIGAHEVTVGHFRAFVRATKHRTEAEANQGGVTWNDDLKKWERKPENVWDNTELSGGDTHPVVFVTLADAQAFCAWLTKQEGRAYAVPAEEQWEWACRAGTTTRWLFGDNADLMRDFGWTTLFPTKRRSVGRLAPNAFGLYDIYGNVQELTISLQEKTIARGGQAGESPHRARSASRVGVDRQYDPAVSRGFRVVIVGDMKAKTPPAKP